MVVSSPDDHVINNMKHKDMTQAVKKEIRKYVGLAIQKIVQEGKQEVLANVAHEHRGRLNNLLRQMLIILADTFTYEKPKYRGVVHPIDLEQDAQPVSRPPYRLSPEEQDEIEEQI